MQADLKMFTLKRDWDRQGVGLDILTLLPRLKSKYQA